MAPNVVRADPIIKHVFEACRISTCVRIAPPKFVGGPFYRLATVRSHVLQIEQMSEYVRTQERIRRAEGMQMTILDTREIQPDSAPRPVLRPGYRPAGARRRPQLKRPGGAPMRYRGTGVPMSRVSHRRRPITPATTVALALVAAAITVWLGLVVQFGGVGGVQAPVPERLAVVQVQTGETLQQVAHRVAPDSPVGQVVERIRDLNQLDSVALDAGQTLIAPIA
jgi:hypothetical protein